MDFEGSGHLDFVTLILHPTRPTNVRMAISSIVGEIIVERLWSSLVAAATAMLERVAGQLAEPR
jgi:hypothetical protein